MEQVHLLRPEFIGYSGNLKFLESYLEFCGRRVNYQVGRGISEEIWIADKKFYLQNALDEIQDSWLGNMSTEKRLLQQAIQRICTKQIEPILRYFMLKEESTYPLRDPYWIVFNPVKKVLFQRYVARLRHNLQFHNEESILISRFNESLQSIEKYLQQSSKCLITDMLIYFHLKAVLENLPESNLATFITQRQSILIFLSNFQENTIVPMQQKLHQGQPFSFKGEVNVQEYQEKDKVIKDSFFQQLPLSFIVAGTFLYAFSSRG